MYIFTSTARLLASCTYTSSSKQSQVTTHISMYRLPAPVKAINHNLSIASNQNCKMVTQFLTQEKRIVNMDVSQVSQFLGELINIRFL